MSSPLQSVFGRNGGSRQIAIIAVGVIVTAAVYGVSVWATRPTMVPLYADVPIESVGRITDKLTENGITAQTNAAGTTILIPAADLARARVAMARDPLPETGRPGLELFDKPTWGMTDFTQKVNFSRAVEGELERTIGKLENVEAVQVHLVVEDQSLYKKNERKSKASVMLRMKGGEAPSAATVLGIARTVAGSVGGLDAEHVTIVDERGRPLTMEDDGTVAGLTSRQLAVQRDVESYLEKKAEALLTNMYGSGNARVQVSANLNFDKVERTTQAIDPDKQALSTESKTDVTPGSPQQGAAYNATVNSYENSRSVENFTGTSGNLKKMTVAVLIADKVTMPPADSVNMQPVISARTPEEITRIETLVRTALGVDSLRGDMLSVVSAPFDMPIIPKRDTLPTPDLMTRMQANPKPIVAIVALVVLLIVALISLAALKPKKEKQQAAIAPAPAYPELPSSAQMAAAQMAQPEPYIEERKPIVLPPVPSSPEREQAIATVEQRPEAAVRVVRNWLRTT